jgi:regulator of sigma E protease
MTILIKILQFVLSLSILVIIHELGHFTMAKIFKTRVEKFYLFFDPWFALFKFKKGETEYGVGWLPLGGYVKISGMIDESMDKEQMKLPPQPFEFRSKSSGQRLLIMIGGVLFNFVLAMLIYVTVLFAWGETYLPTSSVKYGIVTDSVGKSIGLRNGDKILSVDNQHIENFIQISADIVLNKRKTIQVERDGQIVNIDVPQSYIPQMLKGKGQIEPRTPFGPFVIAVFGKGSPAEAAGVKKEDELVGIDGMRFTWFDQFQTYLKENKDRQITLNVKRDVDTSLNILTDTLATWAIGSALIVVMRDQSQTLGQKKLFFPQKL